MIDEGGAKTGKLIGQTPFFGCLACEGDNRQLTLPVGNRNLKAFQRT